MNLDELSQQTCEWLRAEGPDSDIVVSTRIRLARNLSDFPFIRRCTDIDRAGIESLVLRRLELRPEFAGLQRIDVESLDELDRRFLVERQLISRELAEAEGARSLLLEPNERLAVMINEEDHLRLQVMKSGLQIAEAWQSIDRWDNLLQEVLQVAFHDRWGYLTACPTNVGTGLRVSVMVHLPALVQTRQIERVFKSLQKISLAVRGLFGEGSQAMGDFYQISNQLTLGRSEAELLEQVGEVVPALIDYERKARDFLIASAREELTEQVRTALKTLRKSNRISSEETMHLLSKLRMGVHLKLNDELDIPLINRLFLQTQPAHLQKLRGGPLGSDERNRARAEYLQAALAGLGEGTT
ncbi:MAG TPA: protein arginine kinase [Planctomycetaceae bacterium]|nr:protein arginine kinase [Planctomycetaceae bacterium]HRF02375.1 protein arginine kinase [Pirellulaceae bacterium]